MDPVEQPNIHQITRELESKPEDVSTDVQQVQGQVTERTQVPAKVEVATEVHGETREQVAEKKLPEAPKVARVIVDIQKSGQEIPGQAVEARALEMLKQRQYQTPSYQREYQTQNIPYERHIPYSKLNIHRQQQRLQQQQQEVVTEPTLEYLNRCVPQKAHSFLGRTGVKVSRICLGSMNFGDIDQNFGERPGQLDESDAHKILDRFFELGGNCIDTANFFPWFGSQAGESERIIGSWLKNRDRETVFLMTKVRMPTDLTNINSCGLSRNNIINSVNCCLERLQTDYIDLLQIYGWDYSVSAFDLVKTLDQLVKSGKIRYYGVCDVKGWQLQKMIDYAKILNAHGCVCYEGEYNLLTRGCEYEIADVCLSDRLGFFAYSPLKYGFLNDNPSERNRIEAASGNELNLAAMAESNEQIQSDPNYANLFNTCQNIAQRRNLTTSQVALLWVLQQTFVTSVIIGVESVDELEENMACITENLQLTDQELMELNDAACFNFEYPYNCLASYLGYETIRPSFSTYFEQLSILNNPSDVQQLPRRRYSPFRGKGFQTAEQKIVGGEKEKGGQEIEQENVENPERVPEGNVQQNQTLPFEQQVESKKQPQLEESMKQEVPTESQTRD